MAIAKQFTEKTVVTDKLTAGNFAPVKGATTKDLIVIDHLLDGVVLENSDNSEVIASDVASIDQPLLMAKAEIELSASGESAGAVASDADFTYTDHITSDVAEFATDQPELLAMNTEQHIYDSAVLADDNAGGGGIPWMWVGAAAVAGGGLGVALGSNHGGDNAAPAAGAPVDSTVHVVVERFGAFIDTDKDGMKDLSETTAADFSNAGNADLVHDTVTVHFNNVPLNAINLTGFTEDDKVQFDVGSFQDHHLLNISSNSITSLDFGAVDEPFTSFSFDGPTISLIRYPVDWEFYDFAGKVTHSGMYGLQVSNFEKSVNGNHTGVIAYWNDSSNALNFQSNVLHTLYTNSNTDEIIDNLNDSTATHGLVEFVWPTDEEHIDVIVDLGCVYIDTDHDGVWDAACDASTTAFGSGPGLVDLANSDVTIHFHGVPDTPLDLSGFTANDMIEIDMNAWYFDHHSVSRSDQSSIDTTSAFLTGHNLVVANGFSWDSGSPINTTVYAFVGSDDNFQVKVGLVESAIDHITNTTGFIATFGAYNPILHGNVDFVLEML